MRRREVRILFGRLGTLELKDVADVERLYGKDATCPSEWLKWLMKSDIPEHIKPGGSEDLLRLLKGEVCFFFIPHRDLRLISL